MSLVQQLADFRASVTSCQSYISFAHTKYANGSYKITRNLREFISESSFLKIFIAWETFLEQSFLDYLLNEPSISGNMPTKWVHPRDREHALQMIIHTQKYIDWANPEVVRKLSQIYFHNGYFFNSQLSAVNTELLDLKTIRNSAAHLSSTTSSKLDGVGSRILSRVCTNITAYDLLFSIDPATAGSASPQKVIDKYISILDLSAEIIANG